MHPKRYFFTDSTFLIAILFAVTFSGCNQTPATNVHPVITTMPALTPTLTLVPTPTLHLPQVRRIAFHAGDNTGSGLDDKTYIVNPDGNGVAELFEPYPLAWSPNGKYIVFFSKGALYLMEIETKIKTRIIVSDVNNIISGPVWSPDSKKLAMRSVIGNGTGKVYVADIEKIQQGIQSDSITVLRDDVDAYELAWSPDGNYLALSYQVEIHESYQVMVLNVATKEIALAFYGMDPMWSPDGKQMVYVYVLNGGANIFLIKNLAEEMPRFKSGKNVDHQYLTVKQYLRQL